MSMKRLLGTAVAAAMLTMPGLVRAAEPPTDAFIAGYAAAVVEREFSIKATGLTVRDGHVTFPAASLNQTERGQLIKALGGIDGVKDVTLTDDTTVTAPAHQPLERLHVSSPDATTLTTASNPTTSPAQPGYTVAAGATAAAAGTTVETDDKPLRLWLGAGRTFEPIHADPRWPHFYAEYNHYDIDRADTHLGNVGNVGFGETISLFRSELPNGVRQEIGIQGGLFAIFDLDSDSADLITSDYFVGPYYALRYQNFSLMARVYHQSSHLGDEYLLRQEHEVRQNFSFETFNLLLSYDLPYGFRVYGGGGIAVDRDPAGFNPLNVEYGVEWTDPETVFGTNWIRPVAYLDMQDREHTNWDFSYSFRAGLQFEDPVRFVQRMQLLFEFYDGNNPNGQFYNDHVQFFGVGAHFYF